MNCRIGDVVRRGAVVAPQQAVAPEPMVDAVRRESSPDDRIAVSCPDTTPLHTAVGCLHEGMGLRPRTALALAARTRGLTTPVDDELQSARAELAGLTVDPVELETHRERLAATATTLERQRERVAHARGRLQAQRESDATTGDARSVLDESLKALTEAETAAVAAEQQYARARERQRARRDAQERKFELEDRVANLKRRARSHLVGRLDEAYRDAVAAVPDGPTTGDSPSPSSTAPFDVDPVTAGLAIASVGCLSAPVVVAVDRFDSPVAAHEWLGEPVIYI
jgi:hypothetical protein